MAPKRRLDRQITLALDQFEMALVSLLVGRDADGVDIIGDPTPHSPQSAPDVKPGTFAAPSENSTST